MSEISRRDFEGNELALHPWVGWHKRASVWLGIGINPASLTLGASLAIFLPLNVLLPVIVLGALTVSLLAVAQGVAGRRRRHALGQRAAQTFGRDSGAILLNVLMAIGMLGWGGFHVGISGASAANLLHIPGWLGVFLIAAGVFVLAEMGIDRWNSFGWITTLSALALAGLALVITNARPVWTGSTEVYSISRLLWVIGTVITYAILFALRTPDFTWDLMRDIDVVKSGISFFLAFSLSATIGALLFQATGATTLDRILSDHNYTSLGYLFLIVAVAAPILSVLHSGALALESIVPLRRRTSTFAICVVIFLLGVLRFDQQLLVFLDWLSVILPPALVVMLAVVGQKRPIGARLALIAWLAGALAGLLAKALGQQSHLIWGTLVSLAILFPWNWLLSPRKHRQGVT